MEPVDPGQGQSLDLLPSSRGRQRKRNSRYVDYQTDYDVGSSKSPGGGKASSKKSPARGRTPKQASEQKDASDPTAHVSDEKPPEETPEKTPRARRTLAGRSPGAGGAVGGDRQENGTPQPRTRCVRTRRSREGTPTSEAPCGDDEGWPAEEATPGGRRRRGAAKAALTYLHSLANEMLDHNSDAVASQPGAKSQVTGPAQKTPRRSKGTGKSQLVCPATKGHKRKPDSDSDAREDEDFVPDAKEEEEEFDETDDEEATESSDSDFRGGGRSPAVSRARKSGSISKYKGRNGLSCNAMKVVWESAETTKKFREERYGSWVFSDWLPSASAWLRVPQSDLDTYLPEELRSAAFRVSRERLGKEETPLQRLRRFGSVPFHAERWDALLFAGGPVWAMEWCPTPDGVPATQYLALSCHRGMDERHHVNKTYTGPGLVQLWDVGRLEYDTRPDSQPSLAYALAQDKGFVWHLKWCPAGGWELPSRGRQAPFLPRLGLLAVATSDSVVTIYSLPHPEALNAGHQLSASENSSQQLPIYKATGLVTLKLGAFKALRLERSGQVLSLDWLPEKPHHIIAVGFYDGTVGLWNLCSQSSLLRVREPDASLSLLPYQCLLAHDHAVRALAFCPASRHLLVTAGEDRYVKTWDLRRPYAPITVQKRYLTNEIHWPLNGPGLLVAQDSAYVPRGSQGVHYIDHHLNSFFVIPRSSSVWSLSYSDWMNSVAASDGFGEVIFAVLPPINSLAPYAKRSIERRFPVYVTSVLPDDKPEDRDTAGGAEDAKEAADGSKNVNGHESEEVGERNLPCQQIETYKEAVRKRCLHQMDFDTSSFAGLEKRPLWLHMKKTEIKGKLDPDKMTIAALHKVRFNPNMNCHVWLASGGQAGLVRLHCLRGMISAESKKIISDSALYPPNEQEAARAAPGQL